MLFSTHNKSDVLMKSKTSVKSGRIKLPSIKAKEGITGNDFISDDEDKGNKEV